MKTKLYKFPPSLRRFYRLEKYQYFGETTKEYMMINTKFSIGIAVVGFAVQVFTYFCNGQLNPQTAANFNLISSTAIFVAFIMFALNMMTTVEDMRKDVNNNNDDVRRDFDAVYRYVEDLNRDLNREIEDAFRRSKK